MNGLKKCGNHECMMVEAPSFRWWRVLARPGEFIQRPHDLDVVPRTGDLLVCGSRCASRLHALWETDESNRQRQREIKRVEVRELEKMLR